MSEEDYAKILEIIKNSKSSARLAVEMSARFAMRVSETTKIQARDFDLEKNEVHIIDSKGGRNCTKKINAEDIEFCKEMVATHSPKERIVPLLPDSVNKFLGRAMDKAGIGEKYKDCKTGIHSIRKMSAQRYFNKCRDEGKTLKESLNLTSRYLGHGDNRNALMKTYIAKIR